MFSFLIAIIYVAFISLGLPDSLLGSAWPIMYTDFGVPLSYAGIASIIISGGTIVSSLLSDRMTRKLGAGLVTAFSVALTAIALFGFSISSSFWMICLWAIPYGLGAGAVDAALNNYVALHYSARHMSWLHCFWGVGASVGPYIMSAFISGQLGWHGGYLCISIIQIVLTVLLFFSLPLWKNNKSQTAQGDSTKRLGLIDALKIKGVPYILLAFFGYCALETTAGLWASSYLVNFRGVNEETAVRFASLFYLGITFGRFLNGFIADKMGDRRLIRYGIYITIAGICLVAIPFSFNFAAFAGLIIIGLGCAPIYPSIIHATPENFGKENSQAIVGIQMASAYVGSTFMPPVFGLIANHISIGYYPLYMVIFAILMLVTTEHLNRIIIKRQRTKL
jgi:fucose permease